MTASQTKDLLAGQEAAVSIRESLDIISQGDLQVIALAIADLRNTVVSPLGCRGFIHDYSLTLFSARFLSTCCYDAQLSLLAFD